MVNVFVQLYDSVGYRIECFDISKHPIIVTYRNIELLIFFIAWKAGCPLPRWRPRLLY